MPLRKMEMSSLETFCFPVIVLDLQGNVLHWNQYAHTHRITEKMLGNKNLREIVIREINWRYCFQRVVIHVSRHDIDPECQVLGWISQVGVQSAVWLFFMPELPKGLHLNLSTAGAIMKSLDLWDSDTRCHSERCALLARLVGQSMGLSESRLDVVSLAAYLHDVGKLFIDPTILRKPSSLTSEEFEMIKKHPEQGALFLKDLAGLSIFNDTVLYHHERWDGNGYPCGIKGKQIPFLSRMVSIADSFEAMTSDRPYRKAMSAEAALQEIRLGAGSQFDPVMAESFFWYMVKKGGIDDKSHPEVKSYYGRG